MSLGPPCLPTPIPRPVHLVGRLQAKQVTWCFLNMHLRDGKERDREAEGNERVHLHGGCSQDRGRDVQLA